MILTKRKDGRWMYRYTVNNKRVCIYSSAETEKQAEKEILIKLRESTAEMEKGPIFDKVADDWNTKYRIDNSEINYKKSIKSSYERIIEHFNGIRIKDITVQDLNRFIQIMISKKYSKKSVSTHKSVLNMIYRYAVIQGYVSYNPMQDIKLPTGLPKKPRKLPPTDSIRVVSQHYEGFDLLPFFMLYTGCRKSEALAVKYEDIDFDNKTINIEYHVIHDGNKPVYEPVLKTEAAERKPILLDRLAEVIPKGKKGFIFSMKNDGVAPLTKRAYDKRWKKYCTTYNVKLTAHQLRHGFATMLYEAGVDIKDAQELMGHKDINLTRQIYTHIRSERKQETANKLNNFSF